MTGLIAFDQWWVTPSIIGALFFANNLVFLLVTLRRKRKAEFTLRQSKDVLRDRLRRVELDLESVQQEQNERWAEIRQSIARVEFRGNRTPERFKRPSTVGLDKKHQICFLARQGLATDEISRKLNLYPGETELVLGLNEYGTRTENRSAQTSLQ